MLICSAHNQFAHNRNPERENRLAGFADDDGYAATPEIESESPEHALEVNVEYEEANALFRERWRTNKEIADAAPEVLTESLAQDIARSPFLAQSIIDEGYDNLEEPDPQKRRRNFLSDEGRGQILKKLYAEGKIEMTSAPPQGRKLTEADFHRGDIRVTAELNPADFGETVENITRDVSQCIQLSRLLQKRITIFQGLKRQHFWNRAEYLQKMDFAHAIGPTETFTPKTIKRLEQQKTLLNEHIDRHLRSRANEFDSVSGERGAKLQELAEEGKVDERAVNEFFGDCDLFRRIQRKPIEKHPELDRVSDTGVKESPEIGSPDYLNYAETTLKQLADLEPHWGTQEHFEAKYVQRAEREAAQADNFLRREGARIALGSRTERFRTFVEGFGGQEVVEAITGMSVLIEKIVDGSATTQEQGEYRRIISRMGPRERSRIQPLLNAAADSDYLDLLISKQERLNTLALDTPQGIQRRLEIVTSALLPDGSLHRNLQHQMSDIMNLEEQLKATISSIAVKTQERFEDGDPTGGFAAGDKIVRQAQAELMELEDCKRDLVDKEVAIEQITDQNRFLQISNGVNALAFYDPDADTIYTNETRINEKNDPSAARTRMIEHEKGHRISTYFTGKSALVPIRLASAFEELTTNEDGTEITVDIDGQQKSYWELLYWVAESEWGYEGAWDSYHDKAKQETSNDTEARTLADLRYRKDLVDELFNQYASWCDDGKPAPKQGDTGEKRVYQLFQLLDGALAEDKDEELLGDNTRRLFMDEEALGGDGDTRPSESSQREITDYNQKLTELDRDAEGIRQFIIAHPQHKSNLEFYLDQVTPRLKSVKDRYLEHDLDAEEIEIVGELLGVIKKALKGRDKDELDLSNEKQTGKKGLRAIFDYVNFMSLYDLAGMFKEGAEDFVRMWKRRGQAVKSSFGTALTNWIPDSIPYVGQLKHEYQRRFQQSELDEVKQWKDALENLDAYTMIVMLRNSRHADQVKAIIEKLTEIGRMDWNDVGFWNTLNALSRYDMPIAACQRSDILRDRWLQKVVTDIWNDKDLWFKWRRANDSAYRSGMDEFTPTADQLSNVKDGLNDSLERILMLYEQFRDTPQHMPEDVNPHLYEKYIVYAIENGKMTMEAKFYYIVQGVASGLMSIDRMRQLCGEKGGVLNSFPFIDYFDRKNNSLPEIKALAKRLKEGPPNEHKPGMKAKIFVHLILGREESVKQRVQKGTSKLAEKIDHEDVHYFMTHLDYSGIEGLLDSWSGTRQKVTPEGLKNSYVGFSDKLKAFALLAVLDGQGMRFSKSDADDLAKSLTAYVHLDNILTRNGYDKPTRPKLTRTQLYSETAPVSGKRVTGDFRDNMNGFMRDLLKTDNAIGANVDWAKIDASAEKLTTKGAGEAVSAENFIAQKGPIPADKTPDSAQRIFNATASFEEQLKNAIYNNQDVFIDFLKANAQKLLGDLADEAGSLEEASKAFREFSEYEEN